MKLRRVVVGVATLARLGAAAARATRPALIALRWNHVLSVAAGFLLFVPVAQANPLTELLEAKGGSLCYERNYSPEHLKKNPKQSTTALLVSLSTDPEDKDRRTTLRARFVDKKGERYVVAECSWSDTANRTVQNQPILPAFRRQSGVECMTMVDADATSAEEGAYAIVQIVPASKIMLFLDDYITAWASFDRSRDALSFDLGVDDRIFALTAVEAAACKAMDSKLPPWWRVGQ